MNVKARFLRYRGMLSRSFLLALSTLILMLSNSASAQTKLSLQPVTVTKNSLSIAVDPRIELLSIVQYLSDYGNTHRGLVTRLNHSYRKEVDEWFFRSKSHPVIEKLLAGINGCFHGPCSYHIFQGDKLLKEGFYNEKFVINGG